MTTIYGDQLFPCTNCYYVSQINYCHKAIYNLNTEYQEVNSSQVMSCFFELDVASNYKVFSFEVPEFV